MEWEQKYKLLNEEVQHDIYHKFSGIMCSLESLFDARYNNNFISDEDLKIHLASLISRNKEVAKMIKEAYEKHSQDIQLNEPCRHCTVKRLPPTLL